jgi:succinate dehydrogenase iron-sulfur subunit
MGAALTSVTVKLRIRRTSGWQDFTVQVSRDSYVLDALEAAGAQDSSLLFRHSCHHASCGSCGLRINGREHLPCITPIEKFKNSNWALRLEPLRNFPLIGDLLVDFQSLMQQLDLIDLPPTRSVEEQSESQGEKRNLERLLPFADQDVPDFSSGFNRFENCIECGLCMSACPIVGSDPDYLGPVVLAAAGRLVAELRGRTLTELLHQIDQDHGLWRCHGVFECTEVCPSNVDPAREIMSLRNLHLRSLKDMRRS